MEGYKIDPKTKQFIYDGAIEKADERCPRCKRFTTNRLQKNIYVCHHCGEAFTAEELNQIKQARKEKSERLKQLNKKRVQEKTKMVKELSKQGLSAKEISTQMCLSKQTINRYLKKINPPQNKNRET